MNKTTKAKLLFLQLFADGGADGNATGAEPGATEAAAAPQSGEKGLPIIYLDKENQQETPDAEGSQEAEEPDIAAEFDALIKKDGKYHDEFEKRFKTALDGRMKQNKAQNEAYEKSQKVMQRLATIYGKDPDDIDGIESALDADDNLYSSRAETEGVSVDTFKELSRLRTEEAIRKRAEAENQAQVKMQKDFERWFGEVEQMKDEYPDFDFRSEFENDETFARLLFNGVGVRNAYESLHIDDIKHNVTKEAEMRLSKSLAANQNRPEENAASRNAAATARRDVASFTDEELDMIDRESRKNRVTLGNTYLY